MTYYDYSAAISKICLAGIFLLVVAAVIYGCVTPKVVDNGYVRNKHWRYEVHEKEDYQEYVCRSETETYTDFDGNTKSRDVQKCAWETKTRTTNSWVTSGAHPTEPYWPSYTIQPGRYESRYSSHYVVFMVEGEEYNKHTYLRQEYDNFKIEQIYKLSINYFNYVIHYELVR